MPDNLSDSGKTPSFTVGRMSSATDNWPNRPVSSIEFVLFFDDQAYFRLVEAGRPAQLP